MSGSLNEYGKVVIFHANCPDGFFSAWAARRSLGCKGVRFVPCSHGNSPPDVKGKEVYVLDFSFDRDTLVQMNEDAEFLRVLDHHETSIKRFEGLDDFCLLDLDHSGAVITWDYFFTNGMPELLSYIEDRDLWRWELPDSKEINAAVSSYPLDFELWDKMLEDPDLLGRLAAEGSAILRYQSQQVERICKNARWTKIQDLSIPAVNSAMLQSEIGARLCEEHPLAMIWCVPQRGHVRVSLRGDGTYHLGNIAGIFGGGGHRNAAGFNMHTDTFYRVFLKNSEASKSAL